MKFKKGQIVQIRKDIEDISTDLTTEMITQAGKCYRIANICTVAGELEIYLDIPELDSSYWKEIELLPLAVNKGRFTNVKE